MSTTGIVGFLESIATKLGVGLEALEDVLAAILCVRSDRVSHEETGAQGGARRHPVSTK